MMHVPSGSQWILSRIDADGYEEFSGAEYRSAGCTEEYIVTSRSLAQTGEDESLSIEGDIGGGLILKRQISIHKDKPEILQINSSIVSCSVGDGSGGLPRLVCLRVHPQFVLLHPSEVFISFVSINGSKHEIWPESGDHHLDGDLRPNGEWMLVDRCVGLALINRFNPDEIDNCLIHWGIGSVNLELWSGERPVSKDTPIKISHQYEVKQIS